MREVPAAGDILVPRGPYALSPPFGHADRQAPKHKWVRNLINLSGSYGRPAPAPLAVLGTWYESVQTGGKTYRVRVWYVIGPEGYRTFSDPGNSMGQVFRLVRPGRKSPSSRDKM